MLDLAEGLDLAGHTLILPSVAVGNVGQLALDLLIASLGLRRVGRLFDAAFIPLVGADPYNEASEDICTACDLYADEGLGLVALQIRSPIAGRPVKFLHEVLNFVTDRKIGKVIILTSSFGHEKRDEQIRTVPFRYIATDNLKSEYGKQFEELSWLPLEPKLQDDFSGQTVIQIHGGGFAKTLFELLQNNSIPSLVLLKFCSEGDNIPDAVELTNYLNQWLKIIPLDDRKACKLKFPPSWKFLFGNSAPRGIY